MGMLNKYILWMDKENTKDIKFEMIEFFKTMPTHNQLKILDRLEKRNRTELLVLILIVAIYGLMLGAVTGYYYGAKYGIS